MNLPFQKTSLTNAIYSKSSDDIIIPVNTRSKDLHEKPLQCVTSGRLYGNG